MLDSMSSLFGKYMCPCITMEEEVKHQFKNGINLIGSFSRQKGLAESSCFRQIFEPHQLFLFGMKHLYAKF